MIDLKKVEERKTSIINLKKDKGISNQKAQVVLCLDYSYSMNNLYNNGTVQRTLERILPLGLAFDDNNEVDFYIFENGFNKLPENVTLDNIDNYINTKVLANYSMGGTNYAPVINQIVEDFLPTKTVTKKKLFRTVTETIPSDEPLDLPVYVLFITDGDNSDHAETELAIRNASNYGIFFQFVGIGNAKLNFLEKLDNLTGRVIDNANFFTINDLDGCTDDKLYKLLMNEFPDWLTLAKNHNQIK